MGNKARKEWNTERLFEYSYGNQLKVDTGVQRTRSLMDRAALWLRGDLYFNNYNINKHIKLSVKK